MFKAAPAPVVDETTNRLAGLNTLSGQIVLTCIILAAISLIVAGAVTVWAHYSRSNRAKAGSLAFIPRVMLGAAILSSIGGGIAYGASGYGTTGLMPAEARTVSVDLTRTAPKATCTNTEKKEIELTSNRDGITPEFRDALVPLIGEAGVEKLGISKSSTPEKAEIEWTPKGPDCTSGNTTSDACKQVTVKMWLPSGGGDGDRREEKFDPANSSECSAK